MTLQKTEGLGVVYLSLNVRKPPFDDIHARRAIAYSVDREGLVRSAIQGAGEVATAFIPPRFWVAVDYPREKVLARYRTFPQYEFDLDRARSELKKSKYASGFTVDVQYPNDLQRLGRLLLNLKQNMASMGVKFNIGEITEDQWFANLYQHRGAITMQIVLYRPDYPDPANYGSFFGTDQIQGGNNFGNYSNPQVDALLRKQRRTANPKRRIDALMKVSEIVARDVAVVPVWWEASLVATANGLTAYPSPVWYFIPWANSIRKT